MRSSAYAWAKPLVCDALRLSRCAGVDRRSAANRCLNSIGRYQRSGARQADKASLSPLTADSVLTVLPRRRQLECRATAVHRADHRRACSRPVAGRRR